MTTMRCQATDTHFNEKAVFVLLLYHGTSTIPLPGINSLLLLEDVTHKILEPLRI